jgi:MFS family permease
MISALSASSFMKFGKWNMLVAMNCVLLVGTVLTMIDNMHFITVGKFFVGFSSGGFTVYCPNFINESVPTEMKGSMGAITNFMVCLGILIPAIYGLAIPDGIGGLEYENLIDEERNEIANSFYVQDYWRIIWATPLVFALIQIVMLLTVFRFDTPVELKISGDIDTLKKVLLKFYSADQIESRIDAIKGPMKQEKSMEKEEICAEELSLSDTFCSKKYRCAAWMGLAVCCFHHTNGNAALVFYSATLLIATGVPVSKGIFVIMIFNLLGNLPGFFLLRSFGRRSLMIWVNVALNCMLFFMGIATIYEWPNA